MSALQPLSFLKLALAAAMTVLFTASLVEAAEPENALTLKELMAVVVTDSTNVLWNAALLDPPAGSDKAAPTDAQWQEFRANALKLQEIPSLLLAQSLLIAPYGTAATEGSLAPDDIAQLRTGNWPAWQAQVQVLQSGAQATLKAIDSKNFDAMLEAGDSMYPVCESCHQQFWYPAPAQ